jgi:glycerol-3-phosphate acyltransferase PlsY
MALVLAESFPDPNRVMLLWGACIVAAYLVGSFPTAHLLARSRGVDLGQVGSKSYGATNLGRTLGRSWGVLCFVIDAAKGALPVAAAGALMGLLGDAPGSYAAAQAWLWLAVAFAAIVGHTLSPWIRFKGGKGVATGFGALVAMWPVLTVPAALALVLWCVLVLVFRMVSLASMVSAVSVPCTVLVTALAANGATGVRDAVPFLAASGLIALFVVWKHRANIARIRVGTESRVLEKKSAAQPTDRSTPAATQPDAPEGKQP